MILTLKLNSPEEFMILFTQSETLLDGTMSSEVLICIQNSISATAERKHK